MFFTKFCVTMLQINSNIYGFFSGIFISLGIEIFSDIVTQKFNITLQLPWLLSSTLFLISGALCMWISVKVSRYQEYFIRNKIDKQKINDFLDNITIGEKKKCFNLFFSLIFSFLLGAMTLVFNWFFVS